MFLNVWMIWLIGILHFRLLHLVESGIVKYMLSENLPNTEICPQNLGGTERQLRNADLTMTYWIIAAGFCTSMVVFFTEVSKLYSIKCWKLWLIKWFSSLVLTQIDFLQMFECTIVGVWPDDTHRIQTEANGGAENRNGHHYTNAGIRHAIQSHQPTKRLDIWPYTESYRRRNATTQFGAQSNVRPESSVYGLSQWIQYKSFVTSPISADKCITITIFIFEILMSDKVFLIREFV